MLLLDIGRRDPGAITTEDWSFSRWTAYQCERTNHEPGPLVWRTAADHPVPGRGALFTFIYGGQSAAK